MKILEKQLLAEVQGIRLTRMSILAPEIAQKAKAGQFIALMVKELGERIPLTVVDKTADSITIIFQEVGLTTKLLGKMNVGDSLYAIVGPLGHATEIKNFGKVILVGGGVGIAELYPVAKELKKAGNHVITILGSRTKDLLILENEIKAVSNEVFITTDDGSYGRKGFTADVLQELLTQDAALKSIQLIYAVGPIPMMRKVAQITNNFHVKTIVSLNAIMVDATGMCGGCRVTVSQKSKFSCVDGPEFDAHEVDWDLLIKRNRVYDSQEKHICNLYKV